ncbi:MAG: hypothetical protein AAFQ82_13075, partial [Myxococcota bacterium]
MEAKTRRVGLFGKEVLTNTMVDSARGPLHPNADDPGALGAAEPQAVEGPAERPIAPPVEQGEVTSGLAVGAEESLAPAGDTLSSDRAIPAGEALLPPAAADALAAPVTAANGITVEDPNTAEARERARALVENENERALGQSMLASSSMALVGELATQLQDDPSQIDFEEANAALARGLAAIESELESVEALIVDSRLTELEVIGDEELAERRVRGMLAMEGQTTAVVDGEEVVLGTLPDRVIALTDARRAMRLMHAGIQVSLRPDARNAELTAALREEAEALRAMQAQVELSLEEPITSVTPHTREAASLQREELDALLSSIDTQIAHIENRWRPVQQQLGALADTFGIEVASGTEHADVIRNLERIEHALGIEASELADGPEGLAELNQRLLTVTMARRQAVALMVSWSAEDGNTPIESFVESGILRTTPNALIGAERVG